MFKLSNKSVKYFTLKTNGRLPKIVEKKSIFISTGYIVRSKEEVNVRLDEIKKEMKKATHNAFAFFLKKEDEKQIYWADSSDDGEVKGTAGSIFAYILEKENIVNSLIVVSRFYGGIKLGPSGLIKMYSKACKDLIEAIGLNVLN